MSVDFLEYLEALHRQRAELHIQIQGAEEFAARRGMDAAPTTALPIRKPKAVTKSAVAARFEAPECTFPGCTDPCRSRKGPTGIKPKFCAAHATTKLRDKAKRSGGRKVLNPPEQCTQCGKRTKVDPCEHCHIALKGSRASG